MAHRHSWSILWWHFGPYGPQDIHLHACLTESCRREYVAAGRDCGGPEQLHHVMTAEEAKRWEIVGLEP